MKIAIDTMETATGWTGPAGASFSLNQIGGYIANRLSASLLVYVPAGSNGEEFKKLISPSITIPAGYDHLVFHVWSRKKGVPGAILPADFAYKITLDGTHWFYVPVGKTFADVSIGISGWSTVNQVTIVPLSDDEDYLVLSGMYLVKDEYPADIFAGVKEGIEAALTELIGDGVEVGTVSCSVGDRTIPVGGFDYLDRYSVLKIVGGGHEEVHQIERTDGGTVTLGQLYDGPGILYDYTTAKVYLRIPVDYGIDQKEIPLPGITVWGMAPEYSQTKQDIAPELDSFGVDGSVAERRTLAMLTYPLLIDCEARHNSMLALASRAVRWFIGKGELWINARKHDFPYSDPASYVEPTGAVEVVPKVQYTLRVEVFEEREIRRFLPSVSNRNTTITPTLG